MKKKKKIVLFNSNKIDKIYNNYFIYNKSLSYYSYQYSNEIKKRIIDYLINNAKVI